ncbi:MAG: hydroxymethylglutaryl-CoA reductase, partial [Gammaproteobacteria bacterium]|nr:hydroxymethylglutaryl-CoA reductase [Gammaproteobacteria bacterium]
MKGSRIPGFYRLTPRERVQTALEHGLLSEADFKDLARGRASLDAARADRMIENVIGVLGLPVGLGLNFLINGRDYVAPMAVEEPSVVAALSSAAKLVREAGGFTAEADDP